VVTLRQLSDDIDDRFDDVLDLRSDALLVRSTTSGTIRATGGAFEQDLCQLFVFEANGLLTRWEQFDAQQDAEALARFDELNPSVSPLAKGRTKEGSLPARRVRPNAATSSVERLDAAIATRDAAPLPTLLSDEYELVDHTTGVAYDREGALFSLRALQSAQDPTSRHEPLATLGDSLVLCRWSTSASGFAGGTFDVGAYEREQIDLTEVDAQGRRRRAELFAADRLGDAIVRLYERYAELLPVGPARTRAAATARSVAATVGPFFDPERGAAAWAPAIAVADHRPLATMSGRGAEALLQNLRAWQDLADNLAVRDEDVLGLQPDALLLRRLFFGTDRAGGGVFERHFLSLLVFGTDGLMTGSEYFEADRDAEALARFDELARDSGERRTVTTTARIDNTVTRSLDRMAEAWNAGDWDRVAAFYTSDFRLIDHRTLIHLEVDRDQYLQGVRLTWDMRASRLTSEVFATRGDRLALLRTRHEVTDVDVGPSEREYLGITEVDDRGNHVAMVLFDAGNVDAAYAELDERYAAGEAAPYAATWEAYLRNVRAIAAQDWEQLAAGYAPDCVLEDHRPLGLPTMRSRDECVASIRAFVELRPDARSRTPHVLALRDRWSLTVTGWIGSESEGAFEIPVVAVTGYDRDGHTERVDLYNLDQLDEALARYEALGAAAAKPLRIENAATRWFDRFGAAWEARDWDRVAACFAVGFRLIDRQKMARVECDRNQQLKILRWTFGRTSRWAWETLATRGERLALVGEHLEHTGRAFGPTELEGLVVAEVNDAGEYERAVVFDPDDLDAAYAELDERYAAGEAAPFAVVTTGARAFAAAVAARDWDALAAVLAPDLVVYDHRPLGWETLRGAAMLVDTWKSLLELAADAHLRIDHVTATANGSLALLALLGTHEGGEFEDVRVVVHEYDGNGKICRHDIYNPDQLAEAWARYEAIGTRGSGVREEPFTPSSGQLAKPMSLDTAPKAGVYSGRTEMPGPRIEGDPLRIPPNAACRARARVTEVYAAGDWDALRALASDAFVFEDREKHALLTGDVEMWIGSLKFRAGLRFAFDELIATAGDRIALQRVVMTGEPEGAAVEVEFLLLTEVDAAGRLVAVILFDPEDRRAASTELLERHARSEAGRSMPAAVFEGFRAINAHDLDRFRATLHDDFVFDDHRRTGVGRIQGADDYVASIRPLFEGAPDFFTDNLYYVAIEPHGTLAIARTFGTLAEGGEFESVFVRLVVFRDDRFARIEQFEVEDLNRARARFEVLA
jgi:ketosteroid isomerase-like protein/nuclear transport factor 2 (NTF2) superfamily protein